MKIKPLTLLLALTFLFLFSSSSTASSLTSLVSTEKADSLIPVIGSHFYVGKRDSVNEKYTKFSKVSEKGLKNICGDYWSQDVKVSNSSDILQYMRSQK